MLRLSADFVLRWAEIWSVQFQGDLEALLIHATILQGCVRGITQSPELNLRYGVSDVPPDNLRAPISLRSVAEQLGLPRETVRRKAAVMTESGALVRVGGRGFIVPAAVIAGEPVLPLFEAHHRNIKTFYRALRQQGLIPAGPAMATDGPEKLRLTLRLFGEYVIDWGQTGARLFDGHVMLALMFAAVLQANQHGADEANARAIPVHAVATSLSLPSETARRHAARLEAMGFISRVAGEGVIVRPAAFDDPAMLAVITSLHALVLRLFEQIAAYGVVLGDEADASLVG